MGIGMVAIVSQRNAANASKILGAKVIGQIESGTGRTRLNF